MWKWVYSADFHRLEYFQEFSDGKLLVGQSNEISEIWKNALEEDPENPSLPQDDWWLLIKLCFSHLLHSDLRLLTIVWFTTKLIFFTVILIKIINLYFILMSYVSHQSIFRFSFFGQSDQKRKNQLSCLFTFYWESKSLIGQ